MKAIFLKILSALLKKLAKATLWRYRPIILGITGNVGKSSTKEALALVLGNEKRVRRPLKSFNNELGLPLTILGDWEFTGGGFFWLKVVVVSFFRLFRKSRAYPEILILEYGVDKPGDMKYLLEVARPQIGIVTAIGDLPVHIEFFTSRESLIREKAKLISSLPATGFAILNADDADVLGMKENSKAKIITFGFSEEADLKIGNLTTSFGENFRGITFKLTYNGSSVPVRLKNVLGKAQSYAAAAAAATGLMFGLNLVKIAEALAIYSPPPGRFKIIPGIKESTIIDDTYNAAPLAMRGALETLGELDAPRKIAVLGDMLEIGKWTIEAHEEIGRLAAKAVQILITVGEKAKFIAESARGAKMPKDSVFDFFDIYEAGKFLQGLIRAGDVVLVKASQSVRLEKIVKEVMAEPEKAEKLLVRQNKEWLAKKGIYEK